MKRNYWCCCCAIACLVGCGPVGGGNSGGGTPQPRQPVVEEPVVEQPVVEQPVVEEPAPEVPKPDPVQTTFDGVDEAISMLGLAEAAQKKDQIIAADAWLKAQGPSIVPHLLAACKNENGTVYERVSACRTLGQMGPPAVEAIIELTDSDHRMVRQKSAEFLGLIRPATTPIVDALIELLDHDDIEVQRLAIEALGRIGTAAKRAGPRLQEILNSDADEKLRDQAADAIRDVAPRRTMGSEL